MLFQNTGQMRSFFLIFSFVTMILVTSCGQGNQNSLDGMIAEVKPNLNYIHKLEADEVNIALRICYALKTKRINYRADLNGQKFKYKSNEQNCDGTIKNESYQAELKVPQNGTMKYESSYQGFHLSEVPTDINPPMNSICSKLFQGEIPENTFQSSDSQRMQFKFSQDSGIDIINIHSGVKDTKNVELEGYITNYVTIYEIESFPAVPQMTGVIKKAHLIKQCSNKSKEKHIISIESSFKE